MKYIYNTSHTKLRLLQYIIFHNDFLHSIDNYIWPLGFFGCAKAYISILNMCSILVILDKILQTCAFACAPV